MNFKSAKIFAISFFALKIHIRKTFVLKCTLLNFGFFIFQRLKSKHQKFEYAWIVSISNKIFKKYKNVRFLIEWTTFLAIFSTKFSDSVEWAILKTNYLYFSLESWDHGQWTNTLQKFEWNQRIISSSMHTDLIQKKYFKVYNRNEA